MKQEGFDLKFLHFGGDLVLANVNEIKESLKNLKIKVFFTFGKNVIANTTLFVNKVIGVSNS